MTAPRSYSELKKAADDRGFSASPFIAELLNVIQAHETSSGAAGVLSASARRMRLVALGLGIVSAVAGAAAVWEIRRANELTAENAQLTTTLQNTTSELKAARSEVTAKTSEFRESLERSTRSTNASVEMLKEQFGQLQAENVALKKQVRDLESQLQMQKALPAGQK